MQTFVLLLLSGLSLSALSQTCAAPGWNGPDTPSGVVNSYHGGNGNVTAGATSIVVNSITGLRSNAHTLVAGDLILIMQMQDSNTAANAGVHEYAQIVSVSGTTLALNRPLTNGYTYSMNTTNVRNWQVVWVPQYSSANISGTVRTDPWTINTTTLVVSGGVTAMDVAGSLAVSGTVTAAGAGYRGAFGLSGGNSFAAGTATTPNSTFTPTAVYGGQKGEGMQGTPPVVFQGSTTVAAGYLGTLGQGYSSGAGGQAAFANAGGGGNDGLPATGGNQYNSGGGGGGNAGAGGQGGNSWNSGGLAADLNQNQTTTQTGNIAGGKGGNAQANSANRLIMGGGGGAGTANNATVADSLANWPPDANGTTANGAAGPVTSSGSSGGGVILLRAGSISGAGVIDASGYRAYNKNPVGDTDSAGGGGGGGAIFVTAGVGTGSGIRLNATGGAGGSSNYYNHGPGGGGGGGYIVTTLSAASTDVTGGTSGTDGCCSGTNGNGSPKAWNAAAGSSGTVVTTGGTAAGVQGGAACLPVLAVSKSTLTPVLSSATGATASYSLNLRNTGGAASNVFLLDQTLPPGWAYSPATAPVFSYNPAPPAAANSPAAGAETTSAAAPGALPVSSVTSANSVTAVSLRAAGSAPGVTPTTGSNSPTFGSFYLPQNGSITVTFVVTIPSTATAGTYHNAGGVLFLDPTRTSTVARMVSPLAGVSNNRSGVAYSANTSYASGSTTSVQGSNYSGLQAGPNAEDVVLLPDFSVSKSAPASATPGTTFSYTITPRNSGFGVGSQTYATSQATDVSSASVPTVFGSNPLTITDTLPAGVTLSGVFTGTGWSCSGTRTQVCTLPNTSAYPIASSTSFATLSAVVTVTAACGSNAQTNTATVSQAAREANSLNNTATVTTAISCGSVNLQITKTNGVTVLAAGSTTSYTVTVSNLGPDSAPNVTVTDTISAGLSCTTVTCTDTPGGSVCPAPSMPFSSLSSGLLIPSFPASSTASFVISCSVPATGY